MNTVRRCASATALGLAALLAMVNVAYADIADQRASDLLTALQSNNFIQAEAHFDATMKAGLPPDKLEEVWKKLIGELGPLKSFSVSGRTSAGGSEVRIADLQFENASGYVAQVAVNSSGYISGLVFTRAETAAPSPEQKKLADDRVNEMIEALRSSKFDVAENHFDPTMKGALPTNALEDAWKPRTDSLGALKTWRIVGRSDAGGGIQLRIINLDFEKAPKAFALKIAVQPNGEIGGFFFVPAVAETASSGAPYIRPASFTSHQVEVGTGATALGATLTIPVRNGRVPGAVLAHGSGPNNRDEDVLANHPFKDIAEGLSSDGIAVLRYDKRSYAHPMDRGNVTVNGEVIDDAVAAVAMLKTQREVNPSKVFVIGHSLGAMLAPEIATRADAAGAVMLAPPGIPLPETVVRQYRYLGESESKIAETEKTARLVMTKSLPPTDVFIGAPVSYFYDLASHDEVGFARKLKKPILILRGDRDYQVVSDDIAVWQSGLKGQPNVAIETLPNLNHLFIAGSGRPGPDEYSVPGYVDAGVITRLAAFIKS